MNVGRIVAGIVLFGIIGGGIAATMECRKEAQARTDRIKSNTSMVECTINGTSLGDWGSASKTYVTDIHGHRGYLIGIWGTAGEKLQAVCEDGQLH